MSEGDAIAAEVEEPTPANGDEVVLSQEELAEQEATKRAAAQLRMQNKTQDVIRAVGRRSDVRNEERIREESAIYGCETEPNDMAAFTDRIIALYKEKEGDVLSEMAANLRFPPKPSNDDTDPSSYDTHEREALLAVIAQAISKQGGSSLGNAIELLLLRQATQAGADIDRDLGWSDAPPPKRRIDFSDERQKWATYAEEHSDWSKPEEEGGRNANITTTSDKEEGTWIKWLCTLWALCPADPTHPVEGKTTNSDLYYGVGAGDVSKEVVDIHRALTPGSQFWWKGPKTATVLKRSAMGAARGDLGSPTEENPGSLIFTLRKAAGLGKPVGVVSQYPEENAVILPPFTLYKVGGNALDPGNNLNEGLMVDVLPICPEGAERGGKLSEFLQEVRNDAIKASERLVLGRRRVEEEDPKATYTYAEKAERKGPKHVSIPKDTAWQEMLWVVERAEEIADDNAHWVGDRSVRPPQRRMVASDGHPSGPYRTGFAWPPPAAKTAAVSPHYVTPASPALASRQPAAPVAAPPPQPAPIQARQTVPIIAPPRPDRSYLPWEGSDPHTNMIHLARQNRNTGHSTPSYDTPLNRLNDHFRPGSNAAPLPVAYESNPGRAMNHSARWQHQISPKAQYPIQYPGGPGI